jgi:hypothetical protein
VPPSANGVGDGVTPCRNAAPPRSDAPFALDLTALSTIVRSAGAARVMPRRTPLSHPRRLMRHAPILLGVPTAEMTTPPIASSALSGAIALTKNGSKLAMLRYVPLVVLVTLYLTIPR